MFNNNKLAYSVINCCLDKTIYIINQNHNVMLYKIVFA